jgi:hypothetical protein
MCRNPIRWTLPAIAVLALLGALPAAAADAVPGPASPPAVVPAPAPGGCALALELALNDRATEAAATCPAAAPASIEPIFMGKPQFRTCVCSCGQPCTTDADCDGGRCGPGITCC